MFHFHIEKLPGYWIGHFSVLIYKKYHKIALTSALEALAEERKGPSEQVRTSFMTSR